jgi:hypothetical protein
MPLRTELPCAELCASYLAGRSSTQLARLYHCSPTTITNHLRDCGIVLRPSRFAAVHIDAATLSRLYLDERWPIAVIAAFFGVSSSTIGNKRRRHSIPIRPRSAPRA